MRSKISKEKLQKIIREEMQQLKSVKNESVDHAGIRDVVNSSSKLLAAVEAFKEAAGPAAINAVTPGLEQLAQTLEDMVSNPGSYVMKPKPEMKKVSLKPVKDQ